MKTIILLSFIVSVSLMLIITGCGHSNQTVGNKAPCLRRDGKGVDLEKYNDKDGDGCRNICYLPGGNLY